MRKAALLLVLAAIACRKRGEDEAARARIFSPEAPVGAAAEAKETLDAHKLATDPALARRVLGMQQSEIEARLGAHKAQQRVKFAWFRGPGLPDGGSEVSLAEETTLSQSASGDFSVKLSNDHNQGLELVWARGEVFVKSLYGPFRKRRTDRTDVQRVREQALSGLATFDRLARGLKLKLVGDTVVEGRRAVRYEVAGFGARAAAADKSDLAPAQVPDGKLDPDTARRLELWEKEAPSDLSGTITIDAQTAAPLACDLDGEFGVPPSSKSAPPAELDLRTTLNTTAFGQEIAIKTPRAEAEPSAPHAVKDPLRFLGKEPGAGGEEEADDSDSEEEPAPTQTPTPPAQTSPAQVPKK
jgi:hypothetical protein